MIAASTDEHVSTHVTLCQCLVCPVDSMAFLYQRFSSLVCNEACQLRNQQSRTRSNWRPWFYLGLVAHSFDFWLSERPRVRCETRCPKRTAPMAFGFSADAADPC